MSQMGKNVITLVALVFAAAVVVAITEVAVEAAVGDVLKTLTLPADAQCGTDSGSAIAIIPGGKLGFPKFPTLVVTSCGNQLFFLEPSTTPATRVRTIVTVTPNPNPPPNTLPFTPTFGWEALTLRADRGDILGCGIVPGSTTQTGLYSIDFLPSPNTIIDGTATLLRNGPPGSTCEGIAWDASDNTIYQSSSLGTTSKTLLHLAETGTGTLGTISSGCNSLTGVAATGPAYNQNPPGNLFVTCEGGSTINQLNKNTGALVTSFDAGTNHPGDIECDPVSFVLPQSWHSGIYNKDVIWVKNQQAAQAFAVQAAFGACGPVPPPPTCPTTPTCPTGDCDSDGDGLLDCWEDPALWSDGRPGIALNGTYTSSPRDPGCSPPNSLGCTNRFTLCVDLGLQTSGEMNGTIGFGPTGGACASKNTPDIFVEADYMQFHQPNFESVTDGSKSVQDVVDAFQGAPTAIRLHVQLGDQIPHSNRIALTPCTGPAGTGDADFDTLKETYFGTATDRNDATHARINARNWVYHYSIWAHNQAPIPPSTATNTSSGCAELPGNDFIVTMGSFGLPLTTLTGHTGGVGSRSERAGTFMHELGHNLNLRHGGGDIRPTMDVLTHLEQPYVDRNCKPNYMSVMNYTYQTANTVANRLLSYSSMQLPTLNEGNLIESQGVGLTTTCPGGALTCSIAFGPPSGLPLKLKVVSALGGINWDYPTDTDASENIPGDLNYATNVSTSCPSSPGDILDGFNDWANIQLNFRASSDFAGGISNRPGPETDPPVRQEMTRAEHLDLSRDLCDVKSAAKPNNTGSPSSPVLNATFYSRGGADPVDATKLDVSTLRLSTLDGGVILVATTSKCSTNQDPNHDGLPDSSCPFDVPKGIQLPAGPIVCTGTIPPGATPVFPKGYDFVGSSNVQ